MAKPYILCSFRIFSLDGTIFFATFVAINSKRMNRFTQTLSDQKAELETVDITSLCTRHEENEIDLNSSLAQIVIGVRRSGKSTLCQKVLLQSGVCFAYVNFDDDRLADVQTADLNDILQELYSLYGAFTHLLLDEIQNVVAWPLFVNRLLRQKIHIVMTGSNANLLSSELVTHMTGRYKQISLYPFSFAEYCEYKGVDVKAMTTKAIGLRQFALNQYIMRGGFPELVQDDTLDAKMYVQSLLRAIVEKDICLRYKVRYRQTLYQLANAMLDWFCQELSLNTIADNLQIKSVHTVKNYLGYLDNAYLLRSVGKFSFKSVIRSSIRKCYAVDLAFIADRESTVQSQNLGWRLENVVAIELLRRLDYACQELYYLRQNQSYEVDFAVVERGHIVKLVQVTYDFTSPRVKLYNREIGGLLKGAAATGCQDLTLVMMSGESGDIVIEGHTIHRVLAADWLLRPSSAAMT